MKWFNQKAEIKRLEDEIERLQGQVKHLQRELEIVNEYRIGWIDLVDKVIEKTIILKNGIQDCIDCETPNANATVRRITNKLRGLL